ncbi:hypothetical protein QBC42DRAFT_282556 [Cladorrhinum samala]|uniref:Uncharacterized protein n=1 Tax=Cladorrhinum samala TaxID=585594 RepID=A0AAV9I2R8_9PEZI|nr:hypothetical protein QBC42DRAFT_282556 [Cladorrhinum samala]
MPLVVPGVTANNMDDSMAQEWMNKLVGKTLSEESTNETCFCKKDLPEQSRVIKPGSMVTKDFNPDRLNIHVNEEGTVTHVQQG